jgi:hypothetical protein
MRPPGQMNEPFSISRGRILIRGRRLFGKAAGFIPLGKKPEFGDPFFDVGEVELIILDFQDSRNVFDLAM